MFSVLLGRDEDYKDLQNHDAVLKPGVQISSGGTVSGSTGSMFRINSIAASSMSVKLKSSERKSMSTEREQDGKTARKSIEEGRLTKIKPFEPSALDISFPSDLGEQKD